VWLLLPRGSYTMLMRFMSNNLHGSTAGLALPGATASDQRALMPPNGAGVGPTFLGRLGHVARLDADERGCLQLTTW